MYEVCHFKEKYEIYYSYSTSGYNAMLSFDKMVLIINARLVDIHVVVYASNYIYFIPIIHAAMVSKKDHNIIPAE